MVSSMMIVQNVRPMVGYDGASLENKINICDKMCLDDYFTFCGDERETHVFNVDDMDWDHCSNVGKEIAIFQQQRVEYELLTQSILYGNIDVNQRVSADYTALHLAVCYNHHEMIKRLLQLGASPHAKTQDGQEPLFFAMQSGCETCVELLVSHKADVNQVVCNSQYLHFAADKNYVKIADILLHYKATVNRCDDSKNTALHVAARYGHVEIVRLLLQNGASQLMENLDRKTPICISIEYGHKEVFELLVRHGIKHYCNDASLLYKIISSGDLDLFTILMRNGANVNGSTGFGRTALHLAVIDNNQSALELLLSQGADINCQDDAGRTPLHLAIDLRKQRIFEFLLQSGANVNSWDKQHHTPLHVAVRQNCVNSVRLLLERNANVNAVDTDNRSPLHLVRNGNLQIFEALSSTGQLDVNIADVEGKTPLYLAVDTEHNKLLYMQPEHSLVSRLVASGAEVNSRLTRSGETPLHLAAKLGCGAFATILMDHGANVNSCDKQLQTPLHLAAEIDAPECIRHLLRFGANIDCRDAKGKTPLELSGSQNNVDVMVQHLIKMRVAGFDVGHQRVENHAEFAEACTEELKRMTASRIYGDITFYEFLRATRKRLADLVKINAITEVFAGDLVRSQFPLYADILERNFIIGKRYEPLLESATESLGLAIPQVLTEVRDKILGYLNHSDMKNLIMAQ